MHIYYPCHGRLKHAFKVQLNIIITRYAKYFLISFLFFYVLYVWKS